MWPLGDEKAKKEIASAKIWNDGTGTETIGNYKAEFFSHGKTWRKTYHQGFKRLKQNVWILLYHLLSNALFGTSMANIIHFSVQERNLTPSLGENK